MGFEHYEVRFEKIMGWEMELEPPHPHPLPDALMTDESKSSVDQVIYYFEIWLRHMKTGGRNK